MSHNPVVVSELANDPDLSIVIDVFISGLAKTMDNIRQSIENRDDQKLCSAVHMLNGGSASAGFSVLSERASLMENMLKEQGSNPTEAEFDELLGMCQEVLDSRKV